MANKKQKINKILIANRGEIAGRIQRTAKATGIRTVVIYAEDDSKRSYVLDADEAVSLGNGPLAETYLNIEKIIDIAKLTKADAIHPGYGFLAENASFAKACEDAGIIFIGPSAAVIEKMGHKLNATEFVKSLGIPVIPHYQGTYKELAALNGKFPLPGIVKASAGGGGKGMIIVNKMEMLKDALLNAARQANSFFGDDTVYVEKYIEEPRHIEVQILADQYGNTVHLFERECSIQRHYQKIIEEAPSESLTDVLRKKITDAAVKIASGIRYTGAGTVEFLLDRDGSFYFLEMNTRIQVEHPVTEAITGIDIVKEQISVAEGKELGFDQQAVSYSGHAIEARICAEDPLNDFQPSPGKINLYLEPDIEGIRIDSGINSAERISEKYDSLIAKMIATGKTREDAMNKLKSGLDHFIIHGIKTNIPFLKSLTNSVDFQTNQVFSGYIEKNQDKLLGILTGSINSENKNVLISAGLLLSLSETQKETAGYTQTVWNEIGFWRQINSMRVQLNDENFHPEFRYLSNSEILIMLESNDYLLKKEKQTDHILKFLLNGQNFEIYYSGSGNNGYHISYSGEIYSFRRMDILETTRKGTISVNDTPGDQGNLILSPISGRVIRIEKNINNNVREGDDLIIIESMKMENHIAAHTGGTIKEIMVKEGDLVSANMVLVKIEQLSVEKSS